MSVSVVIPTYNRADRVKRLCTQIVPQLGAEDELIVLDDGSPDNTADSLRDFAGMRVIRNATNLGMVKNWNRCFEVAACEWLCTIHDDDDFAPGAMQTIRRAIALMGGQAGVIVAGALPTTAQASEGFRYRHTEPGRWAVLNATSIPSGTVVHRSVYETAGVFDETLQFSSDLELFPRYASRFPTLTIESPAVVTYRLHKDNYQFKTWHDPSFYTQLDRIVRSVGGYAGFSGSELDHYVHETMSSHLVNIMRLSRKNHDRQVFAEVRRQLRFRSNILLRDRVMAWTGLTLRR